MPIIFQIFSGSEIGHWEPRRPLQKVGGGAPHPLEGPPGPPGPPRPPKWPISDPKKTEKDLPKYSLAKAIVDAQGDREVAAERPRKSCERCERGGLVLGERVRTRHMT